MQVPEALRREESCLALLTDPDLGTAVETAIRIAGTRPIVPTRAVTQERLVQPRLLPPGGALEKIDDIVLITEVVPDDHPGASLRMP